MRQTEKEFLINQAKTALSAVEAEMRCNVEDPALGALGRLMLEVYGEVDRADFARRFGEHFEEVKRRLQDNLYSDVLWEVQKFVNALDEIAVNEHENYQTANKSHPFVRQQVLNMTDGHCVYCDVALGADWHVDHIVPVSQGGPDSLANYVPSCPSCNVSKNGNHVLTFIKRQSNRRDNVVSIGEAS